MNRSIVFSFAILFSVLLANAQTTTGKELNYPEMYNIVWNSQSQDASGSMPVGGGDIGCNVWVEDNQLLMYVQRSGIHDEYNGFPKLGRIRFWTAPNIFDGAQTFHQKLVLKDGSIQITATHGEHGDIKIHIWVEVHRPIVHIDVNSNTPLVHYTQYESWRTESRVLSMTDQDEREGWRGIAGWPHEVILEPDNFVQKDNEFTFYHVNPEEKLSSKLAYETIGLGKYYGQYFDPLKDLVWGGRMSGNNQTFDGTYSGKYQSTPYKGWRYKTKKPSKKHNVSMLFHTSRCGSGDMWLSELEEKQQLGITGTKQIWGKNKEWWSALWNRSYLVLNPGKTGEKDPVWEAGRNYNLFRYMIACNAYGENPTMFNGGLFTFDPELVKEHDGKYHPDWRRWGGGNYTLQNQRWLYWPMLKWGDSKHMENQFNMFSRVLEVAELRVRHHYGHKGSVFSESLTSYGLPFPNIYGFDSTYIPIRHKPKWMDPGMEKSFAIGNHHTAALEFSYMILEYHRYTGKSISKWLPFIKSTLDFFDQHYRMRHKYYARDEYDSNGKLVLFPSSSCESHWYASNPVPDVTGLHAVVEAVQSLPEELINKYFGGEEELARLQKTLPDLHYETINGDTVLPPAKSVIYPNYRKTELYVNYPMFPFNQIKLGDKEMEYIHNTQKYWEKWQNPNAWTLIISWSNANVAYARMGVVDKASELTQKTLQSGDYRFPAFWGPGHDWAPDHNWGGTGAVGLQEMLMQATDDKIVLLPTWHKDWNADFKLHAPKKTIIEGKVIDGKLIKLNVFPEERRKDVVVSRHDN